MNNNDYQNQSTIKIRNDILIVYIFLNHNKNFKKVINFFKLYSKIYTFYLRNSLKQIHYIFIYNIERQIL